jgi:crotonobetainyl-CoA:carnitine CoA-transferase CaiB-like acyl-CoA transferase
VPSPQTQGALDGVRVLDLTTGIAGPVAGMLLADLGADVVKVHPPGGGASPAEPGLHVWDRNKHAAVLDESRAEDVATLSGLADAADVILVGTGGPALSYEDLRGHGLSPGRPAIWIVMPPYLLGHTPWAGERESAGLLFAWLGHAWNQASYEDVPVDCLYPVSLHMQGIWAATTAIALLAARRSGRPAPSLAVAGGAHGGVLVAPGGFVTGRDEPHIHRPGGPGGALPNYRCYRCADGSWLFFGAFTTAFITRGWRAVGAGHLLDDPRLGGDPNAVRLPENLGWLTRELEQIFVGRPRAEWVRVLEEADVPVAPVLGTDEWLDHPQIAAMGLRADIGNDAGERVVMPGVLVDLSETPATVRRAAATRPEPIAALASRWPERPTTEAATVAAPELPLAGVRVLDLGTIIAGPYLATLLGELGAQVVKVERPPHGDEFRIAHGGRGGVGFSVYNREQRSVMLDLADADGRDTYLRLVRSADVVVDNYRPGVLTRLGIGHTDLARVNPLVTTVSISAFGDSGPLGQRPGFDPIVQALSGIMRSQGGPAEADSPVFLTVPINDVLAAGLGALGACAALFARARIGRGQRVSVTLCASSCLLQSGHLVRVAGRAAPPDGGRDFPGPGPLARLYRAADGWVRLDGRWPRDLPRLVGAGLAVVADGDPDGVADDVARAVARLPVVEVLSRAEAAGLPAVRARQAPELARDEPLIRDGLLAVVERDEHGIAQVGPGRWLRVPGLELGPPGPAPALDEHGPAVLVEAGPDTASAGTSASAGG